MTVYGVVAAAVIGVAAFFSFQSATAGSDIRSNLTLIAPAGAGGGWDTFMREQQQAMRANSLVNNTQVVNIPGAAGTIGLGQLSTMEGQANTLMVTGAGLVAGVAQLDSAVTHDDVRPIARVVEEYDVVVVPADSPYETIDELVEDVIDFLEAAADLIVLYGADHLSAETGRYDLNILDRHVLVGQSRLHELDGLHGDAGRIAHVPDCRARAGDASTPRRAPVAERVAHRRGIGTPTAGLEVPSVARSPASAYHRMRERDHRRRARGVRNIAVRPAGRATCLVPWHKPRPARSVPPDGP